MMRNEKQIPTRAGVPVLMLLLVLLGLPLGSPQAQGEDRASAIQETKTESLASPQGSAPKEQSQEEPLERSEIAPRGWDFSQWEQVPIQAGGRVKPLAAFAGEVVLHLSSRRRFEGWSPSEQILSLVAQPSAWREKPLIKIEREDVKRQLLLDVSRQRFSVSELFANSALLQYASRMGELESTLAKAPHPNADPREEELKRILDRLTVFHRLVSGEAWTFQPSGEPGGAWQPVARPEQNEERSLREILADTSTSGRIRARFIEVMGAYLAGDEPRFQSAVRELRRLIEDDAIRVEPAFAREIPRLKAERIYLQVRPFHWAWILDLIAAIAFAASAWVASVRSEGQGSRWFHRAGLFCLTLGLILHATGFGLRSYVAGRPPVSNMYESIVWVSFGAVVFSWIIYAFQRARILLGVGSVLGALGLLAADSAPTLMDPGLHPLVPVLRSNYWLTVHVLTITLGYAAFALTLGIGNVTLFQLFRGASERSSDVSRLNQLTYRAMQFGVVLLAAGTILGGVWADYSWGRFWGWDPKEVWALIALLTYLTVLHGRYAGWVGPVGFAAWTVFCFSSVVMAWYGVNFVLGVGLHSYGFSAGGQGAVGIAVLIQLLYVGVVLVTVKRRSKARSS
jgi:cytochrome c-type biogenesis protein CcsB